jgi:hypothetical protein
MFGSLTLGSLAWGEVASIAGVAQALIGAAAGCIAAVLFLAPWKLQGKGAPDLSPSAYWPEPIPVTELSGDRGPVLVTVEYRIERADQQAFLEAIGRLSVVRRRDGAYEWGVFEDVADPGRWIEIFLVDSWFEHLRQHGRVTHADQDVEQSVAQFARASAPMVTHLVAPSRDPARPA